MTLQIPGLSRLVAPAIVLLVTSWGSPALPADPDPGSRNTASPHAFIVIAGEILHLGRGSGEGGLELVTALVRTGDHRVLEIRLAPRVVLEQTTFPLKEGDRVELRLFRSHEGLTLAQRIRNRTADRSLRLRSILGEPLWDGDGRWRGGTCPGHGQTRTASLN